MQQARVPPNPRSGDQVQAVAAALRADILSHRSKAGEVLRQERVAERFAVSRMPVREALRILEAEGFIDFVPKRGATVAAISVDELIDVIEMRVALEPLALRRAIPHLTNHELDKAEALQTHAEGAPLAEFGALNNAFHRLLYAPCQRPRLLRQIEILQDVCDRYMRLAASHLDYMDRSHREHRAILSACYRRDAEAAAATLAQHIDDAGDALRQWFCALTSDG